MVGTIYKKEAIIKGLVIAGTHSGCGKTTLSLGIMAALVRRGLKIAPFKVGPDFIDPGHHTRITGVVSRNLDGWMLSRGYNVDQFRKHTWRQGNPADVAVAEGVMGLYDGYDGQTEAGSTAQMAKWLQLPVLLVVDARSMARSAAAVVCGFETFDPGLAFAGIIFNRVGSPKHLACLKDALSERVVMPCIGGIPRDADIGMPERHLGLVTQEEFSLNGDALNRLVNIIEQHLDLDALLARLPNIDLSSDDDDFEEYPGEPMIGLESRQSQIRIGIASDKAFCFYYPDNIELLAASGAKIVRFSPLEDAELPPDLDGIYLGGGYPEIFAEGLSENAGMRRQIHEMSMAGMPIYGECGGFMYLCREIVTTDGAVCPMVGAFPFRTRMTSRLKSLGYRRVHLNRNFILGDRGQSVRGHEFHYSEIDPSSPAEDIETVYRVSDRVGVEDRSEGFAIRRTIGSYIHLHFGSHPDAAALFVSACSDFNRERNAR